MKRNNLKKMALLGLSSGLLVANQLAAHSTASSQTKSGSDSTSTSDPNDGNLGYHLMTEDELMLELDPSGIEMYNKLSPEGKALARKVASMRCNGTNPCAGLNACQTDKHTCAGKGSCANTGKCAASDKNLAVKLVYEKMQKKRANAMQQR